MKQSIAILACIVFTAVAFTLASAQDKSKRPSPPENAKCTFSDGKTVTIDYSSPRAKGRKIYGGLVPYGEVWRTGANEATTFVPTVDVTVGGKDVPAGNYTIFTVPNQDKWTLIVNKKTGEWGIPYKYEGDELLRTDMTVSSTPSAVENFTIGFDQKGDSCSLHIDWANTRASVDISEKK
ncbi:MAG: DUF2911 domain-containing protein [Terriglobales bacterium]